MRQGEFTDLAAPRVLYSTSLAVHCLIHVILYIIKWFLFPGLGKGPVFEFTVFAIFYIARI